MDTNTSLLQLSEWLGVVAVAMLTGNSPRFQRKPIVFVYPRRELVVSFALFALILVLSFVSLFAAGLPGGSLESRLVLGGLGLVPFALALLIRRQPVRSAGWGRQTLRASLLLGLALALLTIFLRGKIFTLINHLNTAQGVGLLVWLGICLTEESIFRGYLQTRLASVWGQWRGIAVSALLYTLWRLPFLLASGQPATAVLISLGLALAQGLVLGYLMQKCGNVIAPAIYRAISEWAFSF